MVPELELQGVGLGETPEEGGDLVTVVRVKNTSNPGSIAGVIAGSVYAGKRTVVRAIGASAVNQAVKACILASGYTRKSRPLNLCFSPSFAEAPSTISPDETATVVVIEVHACLVGN